MRKKRRGRMTMRKRRKKKKDSQLLYLGIEKKRTMMGNI